MIKSKLSKAIIIRSIIPYNIHYYYKTHQIFLIPFYNLRVSQHLFY